jgi:hypothetical protein
MGHYYGGGVLWSGTVSEATIFFIDENRAELVAPRGRKFLLISASASMKAKRRVGTSRGGQSSGFRLSRHPSRATRVASAAQKRDDGPCRPENVGNVGLDCDVPGVR